MMTEQSFAFRWRAQPLFISSTFRDMQAERDHLHDEVFPALEEWLRGYRTLLEPLDLRWGVETSSEAEAEGKEQLVLKVCLDGIVECRPYLIVLLGDRYGWQPPAERLTDTASEHGFAPHEVEGMSVTALEIEAGVLGDAEQAPRSLVYLRAPLPCEQMPERLRPVYSDLEAGNADAAKRLDALKERLRHDARVNCTRDYRLDWDSERQCPTNESLRAWGEQVLADLKAALAADVEAHAAQAGELTWRDEEIFELEAFVEQRARTFVGRNATILEAEALALGADGQGGSWAALYTGEAGAGKSALIAELDRRWQQGGEGANSEQNPVVLAHAAGISPRSARITPMLRRWIGELAATQGIEEPISDNDDHESVVAAFLDLVTAVARHRRVVLLVDAINQFQSQAWQDQSWVPAARPNIRLIATAIPGAASQRLLSAHAGVEARELPPLQADEAGEIAEALCARYRKTLADTVLEVLRHHPSAGNALWLRMAIDELLLLDADDFKQAQQRYSDRAPDAQIPAYMEHLVTDVFPGDVPGLYGHMLEGLEERFGTETVQAFATALALSRSGWREQGLRALVKRLGGSWNDAVGANLRRAFRLHLIRHGDPPAWDFFHPIAREAVLERYPASRDERQHQHAAIAGYLAGLPDDDPIAARERMHHLIEADAIPAAGAFYCQLTEDHPAHTPATDSIAERTIGGEGGDGGNPGVLLVQRLLDEAAQAPEDWLELPKNLMFHVLARVQGNVTENTACALMACIQQWFLDHQPKDASNQFLRELSVSSGKLADLEVATGRPEVARLLWEKSHKLSEYLHARMDSAETAHDLGVSHQRLALREEAAGNLEMARSHYEQALEIHEGLYERIGSDENVRSLTISYGNLGDLERTMGNTQKASSSFELALAIREGLHERIGSADTARDLAVSYGKLGGLERERGNPEAARSYCERALAIDQELHATSGSSRTCHSLSTSHGRLGDVEREGGNLAAARYHYEQTNKLLGHLHSRVDSAQTARDLSISYDRLADFEHSSGHFEAARGFYKQALAIREDLHARIGALNYASDLSVSHGMLGDLERSAGNLDAARSHYETAYALLKDLYANTGNTNFAREMSVNHERLADFERSADNQSIARWHLEQALLIRQELHASRDNFKTARDLSISHGKLGDLDREEGNLETARQHYEQAMGLCKELHALFNSVETARSISVIHKRLSDLEDSTHTGSAETTRESVLKHVRLGDSERAASNPKAALGHFETGLQIQKELAARDSTDTTYQVRLANIHQRVAETLCALKDHWAAAQHFEAAEQLFRLIRVQKPRYELSWLDSVQDCADYLEAIGRPYMAGRLINSLLGRVESQPRKRYLAKVASRRLVLRDTAASPIIGVAAGETVVAIALVQWSIFFGVVSAPMLVHAVWIFSTQIYFWWRRIRYRNIDVSHFEDLINKLEFDQ